mmetsp:Transcript_21064/g.46196  ORF Transcript_21064/g.46196 Transcript_21064/m.46196 type:complete len:484 (-) Transcript_21064:249-1700(-)|eukprot:CAMPEP_0118927376 /NCGR_PEP_ID=MMETSP1169-20130426/4861_1 /TAXON_ID=36882 /ORGANISM="Pyramimonas obovata, Strain CCMP722" /LENGTH=483 /DNA_ID=CAMNT_0006869123 /DNA_START=60 /DNA_END=1511 /DNA_ORIENTATION=+
MLAFRTEPFKGLLLVISACITLTSVSASTRVISNSSTANFDFFTALTATSVDQIILRVDVALVNTPQLGVEIRRYLTIRGEQCAGENGRCHIDIGATSAFPKRGFFLTGASHLTLSNVLVSGGLPFNDNIYGSSGGAFFLEKASCLTCTNCQLSNNDAGRGSGGAVYLSNEASFTCLGCTINDNRAKKGGAIFLSGSRYVAAKFQNTDFVGNAAVPTGVGFGEGGVLYSGGNGVVEFTNITFDRNRSEGTGGVAQFLGGVGYFTNIVWKMNSASSSLDGHLLFVEDTADLYFDDFVDETVEDVELCCTPGTFFPLVVKKRLGDFNQVTTEFTAALNSVEGLYCPADARISPPPPSLSYGQWTPPSPPPWPPGHMEAPPQPPIALTVSGSEGSPDAFPVEAIIVIVIGAGIIMLFFLLGLVTYCIRAREGALKAPGQGLRSQQSFRNPHRVQPRVLSRSLSPPKHRPEISETFTSINNDESGLV